MDGVIRISVLGQPHPKGSKRAFVRGGKPRVVEQTSESLATWRPRLVAGVVAAAIEDGPTPEPVAVLTRFRLAPPKKRRWPWPVAMNRGDIDKLVRVVLDELASIVMADDAQVVLLACTKAFAGQPGAEIAVIPLMPLADPEHSGAFGEELVEELRQMVVQELILRGQREEVRA